jgi:acetolactate synthase-1/2/3 large subunit
MTGKTLVLRALKDLGVRYLFGYTGGAIMPIFDEIERFDDMTFLMARHEQGAAFMAQGLTRGALSTDRPELGCVFPPPGRGR